MKLRTVFTFLLLSCFFLSSCDKDDPDIPNEEEVITTLTYTLSPDDGGTPTILSFQDLDGDGGNEPIVSGGSLASNTTYTGVLALRNEQDSLVVDITEEVEEEADEHQFFFQTTVDGLNISYADQDANDNPIGLETSISTGDSGAGTITVILRHQPEKTATGVSDGEIANAGGTTDIQVTFEVDVQ